MTRSAFGVYVTDHQGWEDGCQDYQGVFFGSTPDGARFVYESEGSSLGGHMEFDNLETAEAFAQKLRTSGDWKVKAPHHPEFGTISRPEYGVALIDVEAKIETTA